jgi:hypothetical protein
LKKIKNLPEESHIAIAVQKEKIGQDISAQTGKDLEELLGLVVSEEAVTTAQHWLHDFPDADYADFVIIRLLDAAPWGENIAIARSWLGKNENQFSAELVLAKLIDSTDSKDLMDQAKKFLQRSTDELSTAEVACAILKKTKDPEARKIALDWCRKALHGKNSQFDAALLSHVLPDDDVRSLLLDWCAEFPQDRMIAHSWTSLLMNDPKEDVINACWNWLIANEGHNEWDRLFWQLLAVGAETPIPGAAIDKAWELFNPGNRDNAKALLEADRSDQAVEKIFAIVKSGSENDAFTNRMLSGLLRVKQTPEIIDYATNWVRARREQTARLWLTIRTLLEIAPSQDLIEQSKELLKDPQEESFYWSRLIVIIKASKDAHLIVRAHELLSIETAMGFRRHLASWCGSLLLALYEIGGSAIPPSDYAESWLKWHSHKYPDIASDMRHLIQSQATSRSLSR